MNELMKYKHYSAKTTYEEFHVKYMSGTLEKYVIPEFLSPNAITILGQLPGIVLVIYMIT